VRIVPSTGRMTAWYAASLADRRARARVGPSQPPAWSMTVTRPRSTWDRMTPELPRAPISDPWLIALHTEARSSPAASSASHTAMRVSDMLVPVSPSGTGYTLSRLMGSRWAASASSYAWTTARSRSASRWSSAVTEVDDK
jgi:hypothetical protein